VHAEHPRVSLASVYSSCFVPNGHVRSPACSAQSLKPLDAAGTHALPAPHAPGPIGSVGLHASAECAHAIGGIAVLGWAAQLPLPVGLVSV
jgi:hypothetical protein